VLIPAFYSETFMGKKQALYELEKSFLPVSCRSKLTLLATLDYNWASRFAFHSFYAHNLEK
jgi:hypothetical protein